jgi:hypothetical protein
MHPNRIDVGNPENFITLVEDDDNKETVPNDRGANVDINDIVTDEKSVTTTPR